MQADDSCSTCSESSNDDLHCVKIDDETIKEHCQKDHKKQTIKTWPQAERGI